MRTYPYFFRRFRLKAKNQVQKWDFWTRFLPLQSTPNYILTSLAPRDLHLLGNDGSDFWLSTYFLRNRRPRAASRRSDRSDMVRRQERHLGRQVSFPRALSDFVHFSNMFPIWFHSTLGLSTECNFNREIQSQQSLWWFGVAPCRPSVAPVAPGTTITSKMIIQRQIVGTTTQNWHR